MTSEHISRQFISQNTGHTPTAPFGHVVWGRKRATFREKFTAGFILGAVTIVAITFAVVVGMMIRHG